MSRDISFLSHIIPTEYIQPLLTIVDNRYSGLFGFSAKNEKFLTITVFLSLGEFSNIKVHGHKSNDSRFLYVCVSPFLLISF